MTVNECIRIAERECLEPPCECIAACDEAGECLGPDRFMEELLAEEDLDGWA